DKDVYTLKHNQDIYNRSRVSVSISHSQAAEGFPWRVFDIMASNSCLLSDKRQGIADFTKGYVDIPMFSDPFEARKLAKALLGSENLRNQIIQGSNACIEDKGRWHHRFRDIGEAVGVSLINGDRIGSSKQIFSTDFISINKASERITELQRKYHNKIIIRKTLSLYKKIRGL
ncbi:glycosyltransferase, partial [Aeromonas enteropelogenes]